MIDNAEWRTISGSVGGAMFKTISSAVALVLLSGAPALAIDPAGFYAGIFGGGAVRSATSADLTLMAVGFDTDPDAPPYDHIETDGVSGLILSLLNQALAQVPDATLAEAGAITLSGDLSYTPGTSFGAVFGYNLGDGTRFEGELFRVDFSAAAFTITGGRLQSIGGELLSEDDPASGSGPVVNARSRTFRLAIYPRTKNLRASPSMAP